MSLGYSTRSSSLAVESMSLPFDNLVPNRPQPRAARAVSLQLTERQLQQLAQPFARRRNAHHRRIGRLLELAGTRPRRLNLSAMVVQNIVGDLKCQAEIFAVAR